MRQCFLDMRGGHGSMSRLGVLNGFLQMLDGFGHVLVLLGVLFFRGFGVLQAFLRVLEQHLGMAVLSMRLGHSRMLHRLGGMVAVRSGRRAQKKP